jgi:hypothetical protein
MVVDSPIYDLLRTGAVGAEIGVWHGEGAMTAFEKCPQIKRLYLIDPYEKARDEFDKCDLPPAGYDRHQFKDAIANAVKNTMKWSEKCYFVFARSIEVILPEPLDFVYIDANHNYEYVKEDIEHWYPQLKKGGILSGHDYPTESVKKAVDEFCRKNKLELVKTIPDWYCYKK